MHTVPINYINYHQFINQSILNFGSDTPARIHVSCTCTCKTFTFTCIMYHVCIHMYMIMIHDTLCMICATCSARVTCRSTVHATYTMHPHWHGRAFISLITSKVLLYAVCRVTYPHKVMHATTSYHHCLQVHRYQVCHTLFALHGCPRSPP